MSVTFDTNILVYATNRADPAHGKAKELVDRLASGPEIVYAFWPVLLGYVRIVTNPGILPGPRTPVEAIRNVGDLLARPHVRSPGEAEGFLEIYRPMGQRARGNQVPDAHLAALMRQHGVGVIYSRDKGFRRFEGIEVRDPLS
ncbi:MAG: type II toxin-antitoxin system VapC family toxin [Actinomycetota bacterium]